MTGLAYLQFFAYYLKTDPSRDQDNKRAGVGVDIFNFVACGMGYAPLFLRRDSMRLRPKLYRLYNHGLTAPLRAGRSFFAHIMIGLASIVVDNTPIMAAVIQMNPHMPDDHHLLVTLATGVSGNLRSISSAAGIALMGPARGYYTFSATCAGCRPSY
jgi:hypothetical protein